MSDEQVTTNPLQSIDMSKKASKGTIINVRLTEDEKKILNSFTKSPFFDELLVYFNQILIEGTIYEKDVDKIDDFILDWQAEHVDEAMPKPMQFIQSALLPKLNPLYSESISTPPQQLTNQKANVGVQEQPTFIFDEENLPSYLPKIHDIIEKEVRRRVRYEMKEYAKLKIAHNELISKMADISKLFTPK